MTTTTKETLMNTIKNWITHDDKIKSIQKELTEHKNIKKKLSAELLNIMKTNEIDCFDINNGKILFCKNKVKTPLNKAYLLTTLEKYFENHPNINANEVSNFVLENREIIIKENIRRK